MSRKKVFKTAEEAVEYLFSEELESEMIVLPPEVNEFTDEEGFDDSETLDPSVRDVIGPIISLDEQLKDSQSLPYSNQEMGRINNSPAACLFYGGEGRHDLGIVMYRRVMCGRSGRL
ncbi:hypothetical protein NPIL_411081 [Nephila pilipes]|uniref:Uncharacterized protein n=1 Tax=Nephila pilipes TaxID=299642 RepID=A0A8X6KHG4_NEPPI|nr:hypothetical protein NPIL_411081 [Nephila pilipes]